MTNGYAAACGCATRLRPAGFAVASWKQWRRCRKRVGELLKLGVSKDWAVAVGISRKSYWHLSRTMATQWGLNDTWLQSQGLVSVRNIWIAFHYPAANQSGIRVARASP